MTELNTPTNFLTGKAYKGDNAEILHNAAIAKEYSSNEWATMSQWNKRKRSVARGEKSTPINCFRTLESDQGPVKESYVAFLFNRCQLARAKGA